MAITLEQARDLLLNSVLHIGKDNDFPVDKLDRALSIAGNMFVSETNCDTKTETFTISASAGIQDLSSSMTTFNADQLIGLYLDTENVELLPATYRSLLRRASGSQPTGRPEYYAMVDEVNAYFFPNADTTYTARIVRRNPFITWTIGTCDSASTTLNIPAEWVYQVVWTGGKYYLLSGAPGHPDWQEAKQHWEQLLQQAKRHFVDGRTGLIDRSAHPGLASSINKR